MKEYELRKAANCQRCNKPIGHTQIPLFWRITVERFAMDMRAIQRQDGLAMMLGSPKLANIMGPDQDLAKPVMEPVKFTICEDCISETTNIAALVECASGE